MGKPGQILRIVAALVLLLVSARIAPPVAAQQTITSGYSTYMPVIMNMTDKLLPDDADFDLQWGLSNTGQWVPDPFTGGAYGTPEADIHAPGAWAINTGASSVIVAIVDSGIDTSHPDFSGRLLPGRHFYISGTSDVVNNADVTDDIGHGTHVAGIAVATGNNATGVAGVAWGVKILPVKVLDNGYGTTATVVAGIDYAVQAGAKVINLSLGGPSDSPTLAAAIAKAYSQGVLVVVAAGNCGDPSTYQYNNCNNIPDATYYPAADADVLAVGASDEKDARASFSNYGPYVDVVAPGVAIYSTWPTYSVPGSFYNYAYDNGTSMSAPFVSGLAGLIFSQFTAYTPAQVAQAITSNADDLGTAGRDDYYGCGRINAARALADGVNGTGCAGWDPLAPPVLAPASESTATVSPGDYRPGVVLVSFKAGQAGRETSALSAQGTPASLAIAGLGVYSVKVPPGQEIAMAHRLAADPAVEYASLDFIYHAIQ
jgi:subtilisin family serine protease